MSAKPLTAAEKKWLTALQTLLNECPSERLGAYTGGDPDVTIFDRKVRDKWLKEQKPIRRDMDGPEEVSAAGADLDFSLHFPFQVEGVCV